MFLFSDIKKDIADIKKYLLKRQNNFDKILNESKLIVREAAELITMVHNINLNSKKAMQNKLKYLEKRVKNLKRIDKEFEYYTLQAYQEYVEAKLFFEIKINNKFLSHSSINIRPEAYLLGLLDLVGELNREFIDSLRKSNIKIAETYLDIMIEISDLTRPLRFSSALIPDIRKKQDVSRILIEHASNELLLYKKN
ncbi:MAG: hypothetical protein M1168_02650 [Candidatus Marsarchaeota archaeon]|nr:hypothetical protein [Candidatus Marsarchaeota archaeon]MCL5094856.1 hypothetical protein [Candidatus Marsarchaeota archaeon]